MLMAAQIRHNVSRFRAFLPELVLTELFYGYNEQHHE
jgi:hypothetical protein